MTQDTKVDWGAAIEAVHTTGRAFPAHRCTDTGYEHSIVWNDGKRFQWEFYDNGMPWPGISGWRIRNVPTSTNEVRERMEALVRRMVRSDDPHPHYEEARAIAALLDPVDGDEAYATKLLKEGGWANEPVIGTAAVAVMIAQAHREGRALAEAGK